MDDREMLRDKAPVLDCDDGLKRGKLGAVDTNIQTMIWDRLVNFHFGASIRRLALSSRCINPDKSDASAAV